MNISPKLSVERIRQICSEISPQVFYEQIKMDYRKEVSNADYAWMRNQIELLRKKNRSKDNVIKRRELIKYLYDKLDMPFYKIGRLIRRDATSVMHSYYN